MLKNQLFKILELADLRRKTGDVIVHEIEGFQGDYGTQSFTKIFDQVVLSIENGQASKLSNGIGKSYESIRVGTQVSKLGKLSKDGFGNLLQFTSIEDELLSSLILTGCNASIEFSSFKDIHD